MVYCKKCSNYIDGIKGKRKHSEKCDGLRWKK